MTYRDRALKAKQAFHGMGEAETFTALGVEKRSPRDEELRRYGV